MSKNDNRQHLSLSLPKEDIEWLSQRLREIGRSKTTRSNEVHIAIMQRRIALLPKWKREDLRRKCGIPGKETNEEESQQEQDG
jgi:hypothetical protein